MTTGDKIAYERRKLNLTQEQLADMLQVTRQAVSRWEAGSAYPETEKIIKLADLFGCSADYLLRGADEESSGAKCGEAQGAEGEERADGVHIHLNLGKLGYEYKSKRTLFGLPLVHINIGLRRKACGIIAVGLRAKGIISVGLLSLGVISFGVLALGFLALGNFALGIAAFGAISVGLFSGGAVAFGIVAFGAVAVGLFADGACACGYYLAIGDAAFGRIALARTTAEGSVFSLIIPDGASLKDYAAQINAEISKTVPDFWRWAANFCLSCGKWI